MFDTPAVNETTVTNSPSDSHHDFIPQASNINKMLDCFFQAINGLTQGMALFKPDGTLVYANAAAQACLGDLGWMQANMALHPDWINALEECTLKKTVGLFELIQNGQTQYIATMPMSVGAETWVMADFGSHTASIPHAMHYFSKRHGLTNKEQEVLEKLSRGLKPAAIASSHNVSICTVNTQLRAIRSKTGCPSATALVVKLARLPILGAMQLGKAFPA